MLYQMGHGETERDTLSIIKLPPKEDAKTTFIVYLFFDRSIVWAFSGYCFSIEIHVTIVTWI